MGPRHRLPLTSQTLTKVPERTSRRASECRRFSETLWSQGVVAPVNGQVCARDEGGIGREQEEHGACKKRYETRDTTRPQADWEPSDLRFQQCQQTGAAYDNGPR